MRSILLVAKDCAERTALATRLDAAGYLVLTAATQTEAAELLTGIHPGAVVIDLPGAAAVRLIRALRQDPALCFIPRLLVQAPAQKRSSAARQGAGQGGAALPVAASFPRPIDPAHLIRALQALYAAPRSLSLIATPPVQPAAPAVRAIQRAEAIAEALAALQAPEAPPLPMAESAIPHSISVRVPTVVGAASARALAVAHSYVIEMGREGRGDRSERGERARNDGAAQKPGSASAPEATPDLAASA